VLALSALREDRIRTLATSAGKSTTNVTTAIPRNITVQPNAARSAFAPAIDPNMAGSTHCFQLLKSAMSHWFTR
jgi:hypothetical protein